MQLRRLAVQIQKIRYAAIQPDPDQPRRNFDQQEIAHLAESIKSNGLLQPISVRSSENGGYMIIAGERRWRAIGTLGHETVEVIVRDDVTKSEAAKLQLLENIVRVALDPVEEARALKRFVDERYTLEEIAEATGYSEWSITFRIEMLNAREDVLHMVARGQMKPSVAVELGKLSLNGQARAIRIMNSQLMTFDESIALCQSIRAEEMQGGFILELKSPDPEQRRVAKTFEQSFQNIVTVLNRLEAMEQKTPGSMAAALEAEAAVVLLQIDEAVKALGRVKKAVTARKMKAKAKEAN
jgi:ParB family chromosome partitioning protein